MNRRKYMMREVKKLSGDEMFGLEGGEEFGEGCVGGM